MYYAADFPFSRGHRKLCVYIIINHDHSKHFIFILNQLSGRPTLPGLQKNH